MSRKGGRGQNPFHQREPAPERSQPWLSQRTGLIVMIVLSVGLAIYTGWQLYPAMGLGKAILWGMGAAAAIWAVFGFSLVFTRAIRGR